MISDRKIQEPEIFVDEAGVLPDPSKAGILRVDAFLHRAGVYVRARVEVFIRHRSKTLDQPLRRCSITT